MIVSRPLLPRIARRLTATDVACSDGRAAADIAIAVLFGLYECREDTDEDLLLVRIGLPGAADDLARIVYAKVKPLHLSLPSLADECPEWEWYEES